MVSSINPAIPATGAPLASDVVRLNFAAGYNDIGALQLQKLALTGGTMTGDLTLGTKPNTLPARLILSSTNYSIGFTGVDGASFTAAGASWAAFNGVGFTTSAGGQATPIGMNGVVIGSRGGDITLQGVIVGQDAGLNRLYRFGLLRISRTDAVTQSIQMLGNVGYVTITDAGGAPGAGASGGTGWKVNDRCYDALFNTYTVMAVDGTGAVTQLRQDRQTTAVSSQIVNPMPLTAVPGLGGTGLTCNLTCNIPTSLQFLVNGEMFLNVPTVRMATGLQVGDALATRNCLTVTRGAALTSNITFAPSGTGKFDLQAQTQLRGIADGTAVPAGYVGEFLSIYVGTGATVPMTSGVYTQISTLALTPGDWDVQGNIGLAVTGATTTNVYAGVSTSQPPTNPGIANGIAQMLPIAFVSNSTVMNTGMLRVNAGTTTNVYLVAMAVFSAGTVAGWGMLTARRMR